MDRCFAAFQRYSTVDLKALLFDDEDTRDIDQTQFTQPALFCVEYSLARTLIDLGITPDSMIGHSLGEYVAACIAGVFTLEDALHVIEARGRLMQSMRPGSMMAVYLSREQLTPWLAAERGIELAANNSAHFCVVAGEQACHFPFEHTLSRGRDTAQAPENLSRIPLYHDDADAARFCTVAGANPDARAAQALYI